MPLTCFCLYVIVTYSVYQVRFPYKTAANISCVHHLKDIFSPSQPPQFYYSASVSKHDVCIDILLWACKCLVTCPLLCLWRTHHIRDNSCSDWMTNWWQLHLFVSFVFCTHSVSCSEVLYLVMLFWSVKIKTMLILDWHSTKMFKLPCLLADYFHSWYSTFKSCCIPQ